VDTNPDVLVRLDVYLRSVGQQSALIRPWPGEGRRSGDGNITTGAEAPVCAVFVHDAGVVEPGAIPVTWLRVGIKIRWRRVQCLVRALCHRYSVREVGDPWQKCSDRDEEEDEHGCLKPSNCRGL
jgi:hypothetical protein